MSRRRQSFRKYLVESSRRVAAATKDKGFHRSRETHLVSVSLLVSCTQPPCQASPSLGDDANCMSKDLVEKTTSSCLHRHLTASPKCVFRRRTRISCWSLPGTRYAQSKFPPTALFTHGVLQTVRFYDVVANEQKAKFDHRAAVLACTFGDARHAYSGGLDTGVRECVGFFVSVSVQR